MSKSKHSREKKTAITINRLGIVLKEEKITNRALAATLGYEEATVSKWATNTIQPPVSTFMRIALVTNRDLKDFFVSTKDIDEAEKKKNLKILAEMATNSKRTGKDKK
ncbi:MAG TPA: helix-turn-helix transcriptional regulator [Puia sp.]|jgi:transcriptional regulator with XRE-family HTH domain